MANQTVKYLEISKKISMMRDAEVAEETGCHIPCKRNEFNTKLVFMANFIFVQIILLFVAPQNDHAESGHSDRSTQLHNGTGMAIHEH